MKTRSFILALLLFAFVGETLVAQEPETIIERVADHKVKARIVRLTAHLKTTNESRTNVDQYIYRLTVPPNLPSQSAFIESCDADDNEIKPHKNGANHYLELRFPVGPQSEVVKDVSFLVLIRPVKYMKVKELEYFDQNPSKQYLDPSELIESDSAEVAAAVEKVFAKTKTPLDAAKAAYEFPASFMKFKLQKKSLGAQRALQTGIGDCTEYACLFSALCRTQSIPARKVAVFNFSNKKSISLKAPNHHIAEAHLATHGWIPVDPNLGKGKYNRPVGFGKLSNNFVIYNREGAWVWQTRLPKDGYDKSQPKPKMSYGISWDGEVLEEGSIKKLEKKFSALTSE